MVCHGDSKFYSHSINFIRTFIFQIEQLALFLT